MSEYIKYDNHENEWEKVLNDDSRKKIAEEHQSMETMKSYYPINSIGFFSESKKYLF